MSYTVELGGEFFLDQPLTKEQVEDFERFIEGTEYACQWIYNEELSAIGPYGADNKYFCVEFLNSVIANLIKPWGRILNGCVIWRGEDMDDNGRITVKDNAIAVHYIDLEDCPAQCPHCGGDL